MPAVPAPARVVATVTVLDMLFVIAAVAAVLSIGFLIAGALDNAIVRSWNGRRGYTPDPRQTPKTTFPPIPPRGPGGGSPTPYSHSTTEPSTQGRHRGGRFCDGPCDICDGDWT